MSRAVLFACLALGCETDHSLGRNIDVDGGAPSDAVIELDSEPEPRDTGSDVGPEPPDAESRPPCQVGGCSGMLCTDQPDLGSTCEFLPEYACYRSAICERGAGGACGWRDTPELRQCIAMGGPPEVGPCFIGGCSSQLCSDQQGLASTCEWLPEYACYRDAACERQSDGSCGWTDTDALRACLDTAQ